MLIYKITNRVNGKVYIGQTSLTLEKRWVTHVSKAKRRDELKHLYFYRAIRKNGAELFRREVLCEVPDELANFYETLFISACQSFPPELGFGYNMTEGGHGTGIGKNHPRFGKHQSRKSREKNRQAHLGRNEWWTPERRAAMGERVRKNNPSVSDCAPYRYTIEELVNCGHGATEILKILDTQGFKGSYQSLTHFLKRSRRSECNLSKEMAASAAA